MLKRVSTETHSYFVEADAAFQEMKAAAGRASSAFMAAKQAGLSSAEGRRHDGEMNMALSAMVAARKRFIAAYDQSVRADIGAGWASKERPRTAGPQSDSLIGRKNVRFKTALLSNPP